MGQVTSGLITGQKCNDFKSVVGFRTVKICIWVAILFSFVYWMIKNLLMVF